MKVEHCTRLQRRYLRWHVCWLCEMPLDQDYCGAIGHRCPQDVMDKRRAGCLAHYKPRRVVHGKDAEKREG
jgi:hypothetical protein